MAQAARIIAIDINEEKFALAKALGATECINPKNLKTDLVPYIIEQTDGGVDYSFECVGNTKLMRDALECCHKGWGKSTIIGVAGAGEEIATRPFQLVTGRVWQGSAFGGVKGRSQLPGIVDKYLDKTIKVDEMVSHELPLALINDAFKKMKEGATIRSVIKF